MFPHILVDFYSTHFTASLTIFVTTSSSHTVLLVKIVPKCIDLKEKETL